RFPDRVSRPGWSLCERSCLARLDPQRDIPHRAVEEGTEPSGPAGPRTIEHPAAPQALDEDFLRGIVQFLALSMLGPGRIEPPGAVEPPDPAAVTHAAERDVYRAEGRIGPVDRDVADQAGDPDRTADGLVQAGDRPGAGRPVGAEYPAGGGADEEPLGRGER